MNESLQDSDTAFTVSLSKSKNRKCCSQMIEALENDISVLRIESRHGSRISSELDSKLEWYTRTLATLSGKIQSLWSLARMHADEKNEVKEFADKISTSWKLANKQVYEEYARIRVASRTLSGTPLTTLLQKIRKRTIAVKTSLQTKDDDDDAIVNDETSISKGLLISDEITTLLKKLEKCDEKVQQYLLICKMTPYLLELESAVDAYVASNDLLPESGRNSSRLTAFPILVSLLTGELLGQEPIDPNHVLVANAPKKPVFITKNVGKRKMDIPSLPGTKMSKNSTFLSSFR